MQKKTHVLSVESKYSLIGIRTNASMHKLAYYLNKDLNISLQRDIQDIYLIENNTKAFFNVYTFYDDYRELNWSLVSNETKIYIESYQTTIFSNMTKLYKLSYLLPEFKTFNFLIKIEGLLKKKQKLILKIKDVFKIDLASEINQDVIKSENNLLF